MTELSPHELELYARHIMLAPIGGKGQIKIKQARVLIVGAGGLGSPLMLYLTAAGIGTIAILDDDKVTLSNLQRQIIHTQDRLNMPKVTSAITHAKQLNPLPHFIAHQARLTPDNVDDFVKEYDIIADGSDNDETSYCLNDACLRHRKTLIKASVSGFTGQLTALEGWHAHNPCYRCLFPPDDNAPTMSCEEMGVLNFAVCVMAGLQGTEIIKKILGKPILCGKLLIYDALETSFNIISFDKDTNCLCAQSKFK